MTYKIYKTKTILNIQKHVDGGWFWVKYSAYPYTGCEYGCEYCYSRDEKYNPHKASREPEVLKFEDPFSEYIKIKENASELLKKELKNKLRDLIYIDGYQTVETKYRYARKMLEVCLDLNFPVFLNEKSPMLIRDMDILKKINEKSYLNVGWSIITSRDDETRLAFEPKAPPVSARFKAMHQLAENKIMAGTVFMPILPFIYDDERNIEEVIKKTKDCGGQYVLDAGLTLWGYCKTHFYKALKKYDSSLIAKYDRLYENKQALGEYTVRLHQSVLKYCKKHNIMSYIPRPLKFYPEKLQINKKIAEIFYLEVRELQLSGEGGYKEWAYRKADWSLDDLEENVWEIFKNKGIDGLMQIKGIGTSMAKQIEEFLKAGKN